MGFLLVIFLILISNLTVSWSENLICMIPYLKCFEIYALLTSIWPILRNFQFTVANMCLVLVSQCSGRKWLAYLNRTNEGAYQDVNRIRGIRKGC